jgi:hypothetical protein
MDKAGPYVVSPDELVARYFDIYDYVDKGHVVVCSIEKPSVTEPCFELLRYGDTAGIVGALDGLVYERES